MKIKVVYTPDEEDGYEAGSIVFPKCIGRGKTKGDALISLHGAIENYIKQIEKGIDKDAHLLEL